MRAKKLQGDKFTYFKIIYKISILRKKKHQRKTKIVGINLGLRLIFKLNVFLGYTGAVELMIETVPEGFSMKETR